jgi:hypothetical protein
MTPFLNFLIYATDCVNLRNTFQVPPKGGIEIVAVLLQVRVNLLHESLRRHNNECLWLWEWLFSLSGRIDLECVAWDLIVD